MKKNLLSILALSFGLSSFAQIVYTDITDVTLTASSVRETLGIDLDNDGTDDYKVFAVDTSISSQIGPVSVNALGIEIYGNEIAGSIFNVTGLGDILKVDALNNGDDISSSLSYLNSSSSSSLIVNGGGLSVYTAVGAQGNYQNTTDKHIPVKFMIGANAHYGWIRVDVSDQSTTVTVKDFAYESTASTAISAGDNGGVSINENELANAGVFFANNELNINGISGTYSVTVVDLLGKSIANNTVSNNTSLNIGNVNNGIYLVQIAKGNSVVTKKVYIK